MSTTNQSSNYYLGYITVPNSLFDLTHLAPDDPEKGYKVYRLESKSSASASVYVRAFDCTIEKDRCYFYAKRIERN